MSRLAVCQESICESAQKHAGMKQTCLPGWNVISITVFISVRLLHYLSSYFFSDFKTSIINLIQCSAIALMSTNPTACDFSTLTIM